MATTWAELTQTGKGEVVYLLEITGIGVFTTYSYTPTDAWYTSSGYTSSQLHPWLCYEGLGPITEKIDFLEADLRVEALNCTIADIGGGFTGLIKDARATTHTFLVSSTDSGKATIKVQDTSQFSATGTLWLGQEVMSYTGKTATTFTGLTRGLFGTVARDYDADQMAEPPIIPLVANSAHTLVGRRAYLRAAVINPGTGVPGAASIIYRGIVGKGGTVGRGKATIPLNHISEVFRKKCAQRLPRSPIRQGYYYSGWTGEGNKSSHTCHVILGVLAGDVVTVDQGWYTPTELADELNLQFDGAALDIKPHLEFIEGKYHLKASDPGGGKYFEVSVTYGTPLWALGFDVGRYGGVGGAALDAAAPNPPRALVVDFSDNGASGYRPTIEVDDADVFEAGLYVAVNGRGAVAVYSASGTTVTLNLIERDRNRLQPLWTLEEIEDLQLYHVLFVDETLAETLPRLLYLLSGQDEPETWCAQGMIEADLDVTSLSEVIGSVPLPLVRWVDGLKVGAEVWKVVGPPLGLLGICPRLIDKGRVGFVRLETPTLSIASTVLLDDEIWSLVESAEVEARLNDSPLVNEVVVKFWHDYRAEEGEATWEGDEWHPPMRFWYTDGLNQLGENRNIEYEVRGLMPMGESETLEVAELLNSELMSTHFGLFGRESATVTIPCTWTAKQLYCGDVVRVTHELIPDVVESQIGVTNRLGLVVGRTLQLDPGSNQPDQLLVRFAPDIHAGGIAPCALATSWTAVTKKLNFTDADVPLYAQSGGNDLDAFKEAYDAGETGVYIFSYDDSTPSTWTGTMAGVDVAAKTVTLTVDPFAGMFPADGAYVVFASWDSAGAVVQQAYAYVADTGTRPSLGAGSDEAFEWTI